MTQVGSRDTFKQRGVALTVYLLQPVDVRHGTAVLGEANRASVFGLNILICWVVSSFRTVVAAISHWAHQHLWRRWSDGSCGQHASVTKAL